MRLDDIQPGAKLTIDGSPDCYGIVRSRHGDKCYIDWFELDGKVQTRNVIHPLDEVCDDCTLDKAYDRNKKLEQLLE